MPRMRKVDPGQAELLAPENGRASKKSGNGRKLKEQPNATPRQKVISEIMSGVERVRIDTEKNTLDVLDRVHQIKLDAVDDTHIFALSQIYEGLLLKMGEKGNDGGQFFTPREIIRAMVKAIDPQIDETVYDPAAGAPRG